MKLKNSDKVISVEIYNREVVLVLDSKSVYNQSNSRQKENLLGKQTLNLNDIKALLNNEESKLDIT